MAQIVPYLDPRRESIVGELKPNLIVALKEEEGKGLSTIANHLAQQKQFGIAFVWEPLPHFFPALESPGCLPSSQYG